MNEIPSSELNELFLDTLKRSSSNVMGKSDEEIEYDLFEEFDSGVNSFLHETNLNKLLKSRFIDKEIKKSSLVLREKAMFVLETESRDAETVRNSKSWGEIFFLSDSIIELKSRFDELKK